MSFERETVVLETHDKAIILHSVRNVWPLLRKYTAQQPHRHVMFQCISTKASLHHRRFMTFAYVKSMFFSTIMATRLFKRCKHSRPIIPFVANTSGVMEPQSIQLTLSAYCLFFSLSWLRSWLRSCDDDSRLALGCVTLI